MKGHATPCSLCKCMTRSSFLRCTTLTSLTTPTNCSIKFPKDFQGMGSSKEGGENGGSNDKESQKKLKPCLRLIFLSSLLVSIVGSFVLGWWLYKYHPTNSELWMVPFGLILFLTPLIVGLSLVISGPSFSQKQHDQEQQEQVNDLKR